MASIGILLLERGLNPGAAPARPLPGSMSNPVTFNFPVISETVPGCCTDMLFAGKADFEAECIAVARHLVDRGAIAISGNCGFFIRHQAAIAKAVNVPVAMSSLLLVPTLLRQLAPSAKLAIITADSRYLSRDLLGVNDAGDQARIVVDGVEGTPFWDWCMTRPLAATTPETVQAMESAFTDCVSRVLEKNPEVGALLFECTAAPFIAEPLRRITKLPIYDILSLCRPMIEAVRPVGVSG